MNKDTKKQMNNFACPECDSTQVTVTEEDMYMVNGGELYCHSVKLHDSNATATCLDCGWKNKRMHLKSVSSSV